MLLSFLFTWGLTVWVAFPRHDRTGSVLSANQMDVVPALNNRVSSFWALLQLSLLGAELEVDVPEGLQAWMDEASNAEVVGFVVFLIFYVLFIILTLVLLLNLLIAMMSSTYERVAEHSTREWRYDFAMLVLREELICSFLTADNGWWRPWVLNAGTPSLRQGFEGRYHYEFIVVAPNSEGVVVEGAVEGFGIKRLFSAELDAIIAAHGERVVQVPPIPPPAPPMTKAPASCEDEARGSAGASARESPRAGSQQISRPEISFASVGAITDANDSSNDEVNDDPVVSSLAQTPRQESTTPVRTPAQALPYLAAAPAR